MMVIALGAMALACEQELRNVENTKTAEPVKVNVKIGLPEFPDSKAQLSDELGITWEAGDVVWFNGNTGNAEATLTSEQISDNGHRATFSIEIPAITGQDATGVLRYNWSTRNNAEYDFGNPSEHKVADVSATFVSGTSLIYTQPAAGVMNKAYLLMHSNTSRDAQTFLKADSSPVDVTVDMKIIGTVYRVMPYTASYNDEKVQSVTFKLNNGSVIGGTVVYDYVNGTYRSAQEVNWLTYKTVTVNLGTAFDLSEVTGKDSSKGIYFSLPKTNTAITGGYTYTVKTDKATYTFESANSFEVAENQLKNVYLNLDNATAREDDTVAKGVYSFWGSINNGSNFNYTSDAQVNQGIGYWVVRTKDTGAADYVTVEANAHPEYYSAVFTATDDATGLAADWCNVRYRSGDTWWIVDLTENTSSTDRSATVVATYPDNNNGYTIEDGFKTLTIHVIQQGTVDLTPVISNLSAPTIPAAGGSVTATLDLKVSGVDATESQFADYVSRVTLTATNGSVSRDGHTLTISAGPNPRTETREITVTAATKTASDEVIVTQEASASAITQTFSYGFSGWQAGTTNFSRSAGSAETSTPDWMLVLTNLRDDTTGDVPEDGWEVIKYGFQLTDSELTDLKTFVKLSFELAAGESKIWFQGFHANDGAKRTFDKWFKTSDLSSDYVHVTFTQAKYFAPGENYWPTLSVNYGDSYYGPGWVATPFPSVVEGASNSSYSFTIPTACSERWQCQFKLTTDLPTLDAGKTYDFSASIQCSNPNTVHIQLMTAGIGYPVDDDFVLSDADAHVFSKQFTGFALVNSTLIFDFGYAPSDTDVIISDIVIKEHVD